MIQNLMPKLAEHGKIKIGKLGEERQRKDGKGTYRLPNKLDHFIITTTERDDTGNFTPNIALMEEIATKVGEPANHLTSIPVYLLFDNIESNFYTCYNCYQGKTRICTGDGKKAVVLRTGEEIPCPCPKLEREYKGPMPCKPYGRLTVVLQTMNMVGGSWVYRTTGWNSVQDILGSLFLLKNKAGGKLSGIPLTLKILPKTTQIPRGPVTVYTVSLIYRGSALALADEANQRPAIAHDDNLTPDQTIGTAEEIEIQEEFYPPADADELQATVVTGNVRGKGKPPEKKEPTAAELAKETKRVEKIKKEKQEARAAAVRKAKKDTEAAEAAETAEVTGKPVVEKTAKKGPPLDAPPIEEGKVVDEPATEEGKALDESTTDFDWI